jgi:3-deoxy-D-manno-octulosonate 8-phosphate phosphatase (KDO 8-P phosphatase)
MSKLSREEFVQCFKAIKLLAIDVDGVLTDDGIYFGPDGFELKKFNVSDGFYMVLAMRSGLQLAIVSGRYSTATDSRMKDLGVTHVLQGKKDKVEMIAPLLEQLRIEFSEVAFVGNELLDMKLAAEVGLPVAVADAVEDLRDMAAYVTERKGGQGAVREVLECYFEATGLNPRDYLT